MPGADEFLIRRTQPDRQRESRDGVQWQRIEFIVRLLTGGDILEWMRMIVDGFDLGDLGQ